MFTRIAPQHAEHSSGFSVFVLDREHAGYRDPFIDAEVESDFLAGVVPLYVKTLAIKARNQGKGQVIGEDLVLKRIAEGLSFLGINYELVDE